MNGTVARWFCLALAGTGAAFAAAPVLRLSQTVATPQNSVIQAYNAGDGTLSPAVSVPAGVAWLAVSVGGTCPAGSPPSCVLIQFHFNTDGLAQGTYTASVTVYAPGAVDSPQTVIAVAPVGTSPGLSVEAHLTPGTACDVPFHPVCNMFGYSGNWMRMTTQDGGTWLTVSGQGYTTLACPFYYSVHLAPPASLAPADYGGLVESGTAGQPAQSVPVIMHVAAQPLAVPAPARIEVTAAQGGPPQAYPFVPAISLHPAGAIAATSASASGTGIRASLLGGYVAVSVDPGALPQGTVVNGSVTIGCNAADCPVVVPVSVTVVEPGPPVISAVTDNVTFASGGRVAPGEVMVVRGERFSNDPPAFATATPLPATLGGAKVLLNGVPVPLYYSSANQIAFQLPTNTSGAWLSSLLQVQRDGQTSLSFPLPDVRPRAPQIVVITDSAYNLRDAYHPAHPGETIVLWAIGLGATNPTVADGEAAPPFPLAIVSPAPTVQFGGSGGATVSPVFAGLSPGIVGLYQVNVTIPADMASGNISVKLVYPEIDSNAVPIAIQ